MAGKTRTRSQTPILEWILGGIGGLLLLASIVFLLVQERQGSPEPGAVVLTVERISVLENGHVVQFTAHNTGSRALADVHVSAHLYEGEREIDAAQALIDHLPGDSRRKGGFYLRQDPQRHRLELRAEGFREP